MKKHSAVTLVLGIVFGLLVLAPKAVSQSFEGTVQMTIKGEQGPSSITYMIKGGVLRLEFEGRRGQMVMLRNEAENKSYMLISQMQSYMELSSPPVDSAKTEGAKRDYVKTGKTQKLLDYDCDQFIVKEAGKETEIWATKALGKFVRPAAMGRQPQGAGWENSAEFKGYFPLKVVTREGSEEKSGMEVTKVEKKSLDASLFKIPEGYNKMEMPMGRPPRPRD